MARDKLVEVGQARPRGGAVAQREIGRGQGQQRLECEPRQRLDELPGERLGGGELQACVIPAAAAQEDRRRRRVGDRRGRIRGHRAVHDELARRECQALGGSVVAGGSRRRGSRPRARRCVRPLRRRLPPPRSSCATPSRRRACAPTRREAGAPSPPRGRLPAARRRRRPSPGRRTMRRAGELRGRCERRRRRARLAPGRRGRGAHGSRRRAPATSGYASSEASAAKRSSQASTSAARPER